MTMMTIAICDDMQVDARRLHKQLERIVPGSEIRIFKSGELLLEELEKKRKPYDAIFVNIDSKKVDGLETIRTGNNTEDTGKRNVNGSAFYEQKR